MTQHAATAMTLDRSSIRPELRKFANSWRERIDSWRETDQRHTEKSFAQQFWSDLLKCFGVIPERIDLFERNAVRASTGRHGYIDLFWSGVVIGEAKSLDVDLGPAEEQLFDYLSGGSVQQHEWPKYAILSNFETLKVSKLGEEGWEVTFGIDDIDDHIDQLMFLAGQDTVTKKEEERASIHASQLMARLFRAMVGDEVDEEVGDAAPTNPEEEDEKIQLASTWLTRLLFLLYGDDAGLWEEDLFYRFVEFDTTPGNLGSQLGALFTVLNTPEDKRSPRTPKALAKFPYVNGALFEDPLPPEFFNEEMREALLDACRFHWTQISPAVFGSMFQLVKSKEARRADGEHYTSETNILKVLEPLFLDYLRAEAQRLIRNKSTQIRELREFLEQLAEMVFLDPACGCGNFLVVAYREIRDIETALIVALREKEGVKTASMDITLDQKVSIDQFHGFELNWWPAKIAETAMFLVDHQANRKLAREVGDAPRRLPIRITAHIAHGNALELDWAKELDRERTGGGRYQGPIYVFGNPPFIGQYTKTKEQTADMKAVWGADYDGYLDYVTAWHAKTMGLLADRPGEFAFVTTNSITQGQPVPALFAPLRREGWRIKFAHRTFPWDSEAPGKAAVHCVIVGFTRDRACEQQLWDYPDSGQASSEVELRHGVNSYLVDGPDILIRKSSRPISKVLPKVKYGYKPADGGNLVFKANLGTLGLDEDPVAKKYLRRFVGAKEMLHDTERWCLWMEDINPRDLKESPRLRAQVEACRDFREQQVQSGDAYKLRHTPHLMRLTYPKPTVPYLCIPRHVSENRRYFTAARYRADVICGDANFLAADEDGFLFSLISSSMFIAWQRSVGGRIKSDLRFSNTLVWNTFPVPEPTAQQRDEIIAAGKGVLDARALHPDRSLADAYNPLVMDPKLVRAHDRLDRAVDRLFGAPRKLTTEGQRLKLLFESYVEMTTT